MQSQDSKFDRNGSCIKSLGQKKKTKSEREILADKELPNKSGPLLNMRQKLFDLYRMCVCVCVCCSVAKLPFTQFSPSHGNLNE